MTDIWVVLVEDRHTDVNALPFSTEEAAVAKAREEAAANSRHGDIEWDAELNDAMRADGWVLYLPYGTEGDCVRVLKRQMDA